MNVWLKRAVIVFIVAAIIASFLIFAYPRIKHPECYAGGGEWKRFSSVCQDKCGGELCIAMYFPSTACDCGEDKCWNGTTCVPNEAVESSD